MPATTVQRPDGTYANNVLPFPTVVEQSTEVPQGKAVIGIAANYFMGLGAGSKEGVIQYDDSVRFMQNQRVYASFLYGNGKPTDNNSFLVLDISNLSPAVYPIRMIADSTAPEPNTVSLALEKHTADTLNSMTVAQIEALAAKRGYTLTGNNKAEKIDSFLDQQDIQ